MKIILSPAKQMRYEDVVQNRTLPVFLDDAAYLAGLLKEMGFQQLKSLWKCSDRLTAENIERLARWSKEDGLSPAVFSYVGLAFQHLSAEAMTERELSYLDGHLRILSGLYGILRPFDGIREYRLEMQAALHADGCRDLYGFWSDRIFRELIREDDEIIDLASKEYGRCVTDHLDGKVRYTECVFAEKKGEKLLVKGTAAKMARGTMVRWMAENEITSAEDLKGFREGWTWSEAYSQEGRLVFLSNKTGKEQL